MDELFFEGSSPDTQQRIRATAAEPDRKVGENIKPEEIEELKDVPDPAEDPLSAVPSMDINSLDVGVVITTKEQDRVEPDPEAPAPAGEAGGDVPPPDPAAVIEKRLATHPYDGQVR